MSETTPIYSVTELECIQPWDTQPKHNHIPLVLIYQMVEDGNRVILGLLENHILDGTM